MYFRCLALRHSLKEAYIYRALFSGFMRRDHRTFYKQKMDMGVRCYCSQPWLRVLPPAMKNPHVIRKPSQVTDSQLTPVAETDKYSVAILEGLHASETIDDLLQAFREIGSDMNEIHVARAVSRMAEIDRQVHQQVNRQQTSTEGDTSLVPLQTSLIEQHKPDFTLICQLVLQYSVYMDNQLFLETLNALHALGVPVRSTVMQTLLTQCNERVNDFNPDDMVSLVRSLAKMSKNKNDNLVTALFDSCSILTEKFTEKADTAKQITSIIFNLQNRLTEEMKQMLLNKLLAIIIIKNNIDGKSSRFILNSLASLKVRKHPIQYKVLEFVQDNVESLDGDSTIGLIYQLNECGCVSARTLEFLASKTLENPLKYSLRNLIHISGIMSSHRFLNKDFFQHVAKCASESDTCFKDLHKLGGMFAALNLRSVVNLDDFCARLSQSALLVVGENNFDRSVCKMICSTAASLSQLGHVPHGLLSFINGEKFQNILLDFEGKSPDVHISRYLQTLSLLTGTVYPRSRPRPPVASLNRRYDEIADLVRNMLNEMVPDQSFTYNVSSSGDVPINLDFVIEVPSSMKKTCLLLAPASFFAVGSSHLLGMPAAKQAYLINNGYSVTWIPVHKLEMWKNMEEKRKYLRKIMENVLQCWEQPNT